MNGLIRVKNESYSRYEEVLLRKANLKKEAHQIMLNYLNVFGDLIQELFTLKVECIKLKKMISYCQAMVNKNIPLNRAGLEQHIEKQMSDYQKELDDMIAQVKNAKESVDVSLATVRLIKQKYYRLAKLIHPDLHPEYADDEVIQELWYRINVAYECNQLNDMEELEVQVNAYLASLGEGGEMPEIANLEEKIEAVEKEIDTIVHTKPYIYRFILEDPDDVKRKKEELQEDIQSYTDYKEELEQIFEQFQFEEMYS